MQVQHEQQIEINSVESEENIQLQNMLKFNPQDTIDEANALAENFNDIDLHIFNTPEELPSEIMSQIEHDGIDQNRVRAWIDMDNMRDVYLVASNVRPSDVSRTLGHEIIGHKGLRSVFGENFNTILDNVYNSHSEELIQYARTYNRDTETIENRRYLTEEFLSDCADLKVKPSWWKEFIASIRQMLRRIFPKMRISNADINGWLSKAHRAVQGNGQITDGNGTNGAVRYTLQNAQPSKEGYTVEYVNENAGNEFNEAEGVVCNENAIFSEDDLPAEKKMSWLKNKILEYAQNNGIIKSHYTPALNDDVQVSSKGLKNDINHHGTPIRMNIISVIPDMLKNSVLVQTENNGANKTHILVSKVRYGNERFAVGLVINENNGKFFYDHEMTEIEALADSVREETRVEPAKASVNKIIQKVLLSSGFDVNSEKNLRFSVAPVIEIEQFEGSDPLDNEYYQAMVNLRDQNLTDTLNARIFENVDESYPFSNEFSNWAEISEDAIYSSFILGSAIP